MFHSFKRAGAKVRKRTQRKAASNMTKMWKAMLAAPPKPKTAKPKISPAKAPVRKTKPSAKPDDGSKLARKPAPLATSRAKTTAPRGASFKKTVHSCDLGERSFLLYVPAVAKAARDPLPLLVMLHGCEQTPEDFARGTGMNLLAEEFGFMVVYPAQTRRSQTNRCWNWYKRSDQIRGAGEPALIASLTRRVIAEQGADPAKVYIAGLSAGASSALIMATAYPDIFAAVGTHSGLAVGAAHDLASAILAMQRGTPGKSHSVPTPTITFHGDADKVVNPRNGRFVTARALEPYAQLRKTEKNGQVSGGHKYSRTSHRRGTGRSFIEQWVVNGAGHAWSGGNAAGGFTDPAGPDASREIVRFFLRHRTTKKWRAAHHS